MNDTESPLTPDQHRAAALIGEGWDHEHVAEEVSCSARTVARWGARTDFKALVKKRREELLDAAPSARSTLESALSATNTRGKPMWGVRVRAAELLMKGGADGPAGDSVRETVIYLLPDGEEREGEDDGAEAE